MSPFCFFFLNKWVGVFVHNEIHSVYYESEVLLGWVIEKFGSKALAQECILCLK